MDYTFPVGSASIRIPVFIQNSAAGDGSGLTGLVYNTSGLTCYYWRGDAGNTGGTAVSLATATLGTFTSGGFVEKDSTNLPGEYEFGIPNAALASGAQWVVIGFFGNTIGLVNRIIAIQLVAQPVFAKDVAIANFPFVMYDSSGAPTTGLTVTGHVSINGGAFSALGASVSEIANGWYSVNIAAGEMNGATIALRFSASGAVDTDVTIITQIVTP